MPRTRARAAIQGLGNTMGYCITEDEHTFSYNTRKTEQTNKKRSRETAHRFCRWTPIKSQMLRCCNALSVAQAEIKSTEKLQIFREKKRVKEGDKRVDNKKKVFSFNW